MCNEAETGSRFRITADAFAFQGSDRRITPTAARSATWRTNNYHGQYLSTDKNRQALPDAPEGNKGNKRKEAGSAFLRYLCCLLFKSLFWCFLGALVSWWKPLPFEPVASLEPACSSSLNYWLSPACPHIGNHRILNLQIDGWTDDYGDTTEVGVSSGPPVGDCVFDCGFASGSAGAGSGGRGSTEDGGVGPRGGAPFGGPSFDRIGGPTGAGFAGAGSGGTGFVVGGSVDGAVLGDAVLRGANSRGEPAERAAAATVRDPDHWHPAGRRGSGNLVERQRRLDRSGRRRSVVIGALGRTRAAPGRLHSPCSLAAAARRRAGDLRRRPAGRPPRRTGSPGCRR